MTSFKSNCVTYSFRELIQGEPSGETYQIRAYTYGEALEQMHLRLGLHPWQLLYTGRLRHPGGVEWEFTGCIYE